MFSLFLFGVVYGLAAAMALPPPKTGNRSVTRVVSGGCLISASAGLLAGLLLRSDLLTALSALFLSVGLAVALWATRAEQDEDGEQGEQGPLVDWDEFDRLREEWRRWGPRRPRGGSGAPAQERSAA